MAIKKRGFIGPLGDDIPAIFPIVAGILLFVGTIFYVNGIVDAKNSALEMRKAALGLSYMITNEGVIASSSLFESDLCANKLMRYGTSQTVKFIVTVKRFCTKYDLTSMDPLLSPFYLTRWNPVPLKSDNANGWTWAYCTNVQPAPADNRLFPEPKSYVLLQYPVAVPCAENGLPTKGLGLVNIITWK